MAGDHVVNLREDIIIRRIKYSLTSLDENNKDELVIQTILETSIATDSRLPI